MTVGDQILGYRLERELGEGGMGVVFRAKNDILGQVVAIKVLDPELARNPEIRERFIQEARIQIDLHHSSIVQVLTAQVDHEPLALVMEYVDGGSLDQVLKRRGALESEEAVAIMSQVLAAVGYAHSQGVVHRDLKPANIMVTGNGHAAVMDFGIAKVVGSAKLTRTGTSMGSAHYMSPEQVQGRQDIDHRTDIYSLGVTLFEMVTGRVPFEGVAGSTTESSYLVMHAQVNQPAPDPREYAPVLPEHVATAILKSLEKAPARRFQDAEAFGAALRPSQTEPARNEPKGTSGGHPEDRPPASSVENPPVNDVPPTAVRTGGDLRQTRRWKKTTWFALAGAVMIALIGGVFLVHDEFWWGRTEETLDVSVTADAAPASTNAIRFDFALIPAGSFMMGSDPSVEGAQEDERPRHSVTISKPFYLSKTEVTQEQWVAVMGWNPSGFKGSANPVESVSWDDVQEFIRKLNATEGGGRYRLPTEAEWEYAARAGSTGKYCFGDDDSQLPAYAWIGANSGDRTHSVGQLKPNAWGLYDVHGNVWEWVSDWYGKNTYKMSPGSDPTGPFAGTYRVDRGGGWGSDAGSARSANRRINDPGYRYDHLGFRLARSVAR